MAAVMIRGVRVRLGDARVLSGVDLEVGAGEWLNVIGPNGAGKTTLLRCLLGSVRFDGDVMIAGVNDNRPASRARVVAYVPQTPIIPPGMLVADYVMLGRTPYRGAFGADNGRDRAVVTSVLSRLDLADMSAREVRSLSGGERQRAVIARALAQQADVLLLDEPTTALDLGHQQDVLELVDALRRERSLTVIATLHDLTLAGRYGDRIAILCDGRVEQTGAPEQVLTEANIGEHFGATVRVLDDPGGPVIVPAAPVTRHRSSLVSNSQNGVTR